MWHWIEIIIFLLLTNALTGVIIYLVMRQKLKKSSKKSVTQSRSVIKGQLVEQLFPVLPQNIKNYAADMKFVGQPIDYIVFDGLSDGSVRSVRFVEIKSDTARLSKVQRSIRDAISSGSVEFETVVIKTSSDTVS